jgi:ubiquinone/menaquinone biosynthesis C-methylase UbiE
MLREACRVLKPGGHYVCVTYGEPATRLSLFDPTSNDGLGEWTNALHGGEDGDGESACLELKRNRATYYVYAFRKRTDASLVAERVVNELVEESVASGRRVFPS